MTHHLRNWLIAIASVALVAGLGLALAFAAHRLGHEDAVYHSPSVAPWSVWDDSGRYPVRRGSNR